jgi:hypothetical protein
VTQGSRGSSIFLDGRNGGPCHGNQVTQCRMANGLRGIRLQGENGECSGNLIAECIISGSGDQAVMFDPSNGNCSGNVFRECSISDPFYSCVYIVPTGGGKCHGNTFDRCTFNGANGGSGITVFTIGGSFNGNVIRECAVSDTSGAGISFSTGTGECLNNSVVGCVIQSTGSTAIDLSASVNAPVAGNLIRDNVIRQATDQGIWLVGAEANRIEANHLSRPTGSGYGIRSSSTADNVIVKNSSDDASVNFSISINDTYGPVVTTTGLLSDTGNDSHPWANYGF